MFLKVTNKNYKYFKLSPSSIMPYIIAWFLSFIFNISQNELSLYIPPEVNICISFVLVYEKFVNTSFIFYNFNTFVFNLN